MQPCGPVTVQPCSHAAMQPCSHAAMQSCSHVAMQPCSHVAMRSCSHAAMQPCSHVAIQPPPRRRHGCGQGEGPDACDQAPWPVGERCSLPVHCGRFGGAVGSLGSGPRLPSRALGGRLVRGRCSSVSRSISMRCGRYTTICCPVSKELPGERGTQTCTISVVIVVGDVQ